MAETKKRTRKTTAPEKNELSRVFVFDMDGTLCEMFYGDNCMGLYKDHTDEIIRHSFERNSYENTRPIPQAQRLISEIMEKSSPDNVYVLTVIHTGPEFMNKLNWLETHFPGLVPANILGVPKEEDKLHILGHIVRSRKDSNLLYVDDNLSFMITAFGCYHSQYNMSIAHSSVIITRTTEEFMNIQGC